MFEVKVSTHRTATGWSVSASWPVSATERQHATLPHKATLQEGLDCLRRNYGTKSDNAETLIELDRQKRRGDAEIEQRECRQNAIDRFNEYRRELFHNKERLAVLLTEEKQHRGIPNDQILFCGMADIAQFYWCQQQCLIMARDMERGYFAAYLSDRIAYAFDLGVINTHPKDDRDLVSVARNVSLSLSQIKGLFPDTETDAPQFADTVPFVKWQSRNATEAAERGRMIQALSERHPTFRWAFPFEDLMVCGVPDGLYKSTAYEFKSIGRRRYIETDGGTCAKVQVNLYGYFFERESCRLCFAIGDEGVKETREYQTNRQAAERTLGRFAGAVNASRPSEAAALNPNQRWKCRPCRVRESCPQFVSDSPRLAL